MSTCYTAIWNTEKEPLVERDWIQYPWRCSEAPYHCFRYERSEGITERASSNVSSCTFNRRSSPHLNPSISTRYTLTYRGSPKERFLPETRQLWKTDLEIPPILFTIAECKKPTWTIYLCISVDVERVEKQDPKKSECVPSIQVTERSKPSMILARTESMK